MDEWKGNLELYTLAVGVSTLSLRCHVSQIRKDDEYEWRMSLTSPFQPKREETGNRQETFNSPFNNPMLYHPSDAWDVSFLLVTRN
jgi:hypothetical protein